MKRIRIFLILCLLCIALPACKKKEKEKPQTPVQEAWTQIVPEEGTIITAYAMEQDGGVFLLGNLSEMTEVYLFQYSPEGEELLRQELTESFPEDTLQCSCLCAENGRLYIGGSFFENMTQTAVLYEYDRSEKRMTEMTRLPGCGKLLRILAGKNCFYLLWGEVDLFSGQVAGKKAFRYDKEKKELTAVAMPEGSMEVLDISLNPEQNLVLHAQAESGKSSLLEYSEEKNAVRILKEFETKEFTHFAMASEERLVYCDGSMNALVSYDLSGASDVVMVYPFGIDQDSQIGAANGRSISRGKNNSLVVVNLGEIEKKNKSIRFLTTEGQMGNKPFSCGYSVQYMEVPQDKLALKILAMDRDFDLCYVSGNNPMSRVMKENAVFYPLNEVAGIEDFFNECYAYVQEAATTEDGSIWMLPVRMDLPVIVGDTSASGAVSWPEDADLTFSEYFALLDPLTTEQLAKAEKSYVQKNFLQTYTVKNRSVNTEVFREIMRLFRAKQDVWERCKTDGSYLPSYEKDSYILSDVLHYTESFIRSNLKGYGPDARVYTYPKAEKTERNAGTCDYFVVNPNSEHLEDVIAFLESYILYFRNSKETPFFFHTLDTQGNAVLEQVRSIYENGELIFGVDPELYEGYSDVINGSMDMEEYIARTDAKLKIYFEE